jgi:diguanylate cyclase (GGDEF)-like protein
MKRDEGWGFWAQSGLGLREMSLPPQGMWGALWSAQKQDLLLRHYRSWVVLARVRVWSMLWAILSLLGVPVDLLLTVGSHRMIGLRLAFGQTVLAASLIFVSYRVGNRTARNQPPQQGEVWRAYWLLFGVILAFFVAILPQINALRASPDALGRLYAGSYEMFPVMLAASIGLLPVTLSEGSLLVFLCLSVLWASQSFLSHGAGQSAGVVSLGWLWDLSMTGGIGVLSGVSQTALLLRNFRDIATDPLTGIWNRRAGLSLLALHWIRPDSPLRSARASRNDGSRLSVVLLDIDHFKRINDRYGHDTGDRVLVALAGRLRRGVRPNDAVVRWGGEEFVLILPGAALADAVRRAEVMLLEMSNLIPGIGKISFSAGVAEQNTDGAQNFRSLVAIADRRMYAAKQAGRNRVCHQD